MSRDGSISFLWGDKERTFRLGVEEWEKIQEKCDVGPSEILNRLAPVFVALEAGLTLDQAVANGYIGTWRIHDVREPLYRGLIRGGLDPTSAGRVVRELVDERPLIESVGPAYRVVHASVIGAPDEPLGEPGGETKASPTESSPSQTTTGPARSSASPRPRSGPARSGNSSPPSKAGAKPTALRKAQHHQPPKSTTP